MNTIQINEQIYTEEDITNLILLTKQLLEIKDDQNAKLIAMNAKLLNEESKVKDLKMKLWLCQSSHLNKYEA